MTTGKQIRAARMLVEWDAEDLAKKTGLSRESILNIERSVFRPRPATLEKIVTVFKENGVEFEGERGVSLIIDDYRILEGEGCYLKLLDEVYHDLRGNKTAEALFISADDALSPQEVVEANSRIREAGIKCRYLSHEEAKRFDYDLEDYRLVPKKHYKNSVMIIFGEKVATVRAHGKDILVVRDKDQADMLRGLFNMIWEKALKPEKQKIEKKLKVQK